MNKMVKYYKIIVWLNRKAWNDYQAYIDTEERIIVDRERIIREAFYNAENIYIDKKQIKELMREPETKVLCEMFVQAVYNAYKKYKGE